MRRSTAPVGHSLVGALFYHGRLAGPSPSRGAKTRQVVSSACRCHESRERAEPLDRAELVEGEQPGGGGAGCAERQRGAAA